MAHAIATMLIVGGLGGLWVAAGHIGRARAAARAEDAALVARAGDLPAAGRDTRCPRCRGRHCHSWRVNGAECLPQRAPTMTDTLGGAGVHEPAAVLGRLVPVRWSPLALRTRVALAPTWWEARLGRPAQLGTRRVVALP